MEESPEVDKALVTSSLFCARVPRRYLLAGHTQLTIYRDDIDYICRARFEP